MSSSSSFPPCTSTKGPSGRLPQSYIDRHFFELADKIAAEQAGNSLPLPTKEAKQYIVCYPPKRAYLATSFSSQTKNENTLSSYNDKFFGDNTTSEQEHQGNRFFCNPLVERYFPDGNPDFVVPNLHSLTDRHVLYIADWSTTCARYADMCYLVPIAQLRPASLTILLPYFPSGTKEREEYEGSVATANVDSFLLSSLPGQPIVLTVDLHTLQNQFYFHTTARLLSVMPSLFTTTMMVAGKKLVFSSSALPCLQTLATRFETVVPPPLIPFDDAHSVISFPDEGSKKRFKCFFPTQKHAVCSKMRGEGDQRFITLTEGCVKDKDVLIVDDLVRSGGTLFECAKALLQHGARSISIFVTHAAFDNLSCIERFFKPLNAEGSKIRRFYTTDSNPQWLSVLKENDKKDLFVVFPLMSLIEQYL